MSFEIESKTSHPKSKWLKFSPRDIWPTRFHAKQACKSIERDNPTLKTRIVEVDLCFHKWEEQPGEPPVDICIHCGEVRE